ncbi:MAG TPA: carboxypeptidase regulatory-like domain-containing protein [Bryobacteraceae bacterium]|nr:carboxypeptidase regulatory-like domain-containing protein [Bryobacteraceae bacterium]
MVLTAAVLFPAESQGQTTQGLISGRLLDSSTGQPIANANVVFSSGLTNLGGGAPSDASGNYYLPLLSPGFYTIRITATGYQAQEIQQLELTVAARVELDFKLRPLSDVWEAGQYNSVFLPGSKTIVTFFGPDVDTTKSGSFDAQKGRRAPLESTVSEVIDKGELDNLPLEGRDIYSMLVTQPGVTSDAATGRGLGLAINGTRPTASNFLLDGLENNNYLTSGPLTPIAPEAIQEYRVSTNNFSAEYGRTAGYVANAITRPGSDQFHGLAYFYIKNDVLDANGFQANLAGMPRTPDKEDQSGYFVSGPILKNRLFFSSAYEYLRTRSFQDPVAFAFPTTVFVNTYNVSPVARKLLTMYPAPAVTNGFNPVADLVLSPPNDLDRGLGIERLDYTTPSGRDRILARGIFVNLTRPDFQWNPYPDFITPLIQDTWAAGGSYIHTFRADLTNEVRIGYSDDDLHFNRPHPEVPTLLVPAPISSVMNPGQVPNVSLPGSLGFYSYKNLSKTTELLDNLIWTHGRHLMTAGAGVLIRNISGYLTAGATPEYEFNALLGLNSFASDAPYQFRPGLDNAVFPAQTVTPNYNRDYRYHQFFLFAQDTFKLTRRLTLNYGLRYEFFGAPSNVGPVKDLLARLGPGQTEIEQLAGLHFQPVTSGNQQLFNTDTGNIAVRVGASYDLFGTGTTILRGAFGTFYDRPFDNLWENVRNNSVVLPFVDVNSVNKPINYLQPVSTIFSTVSTTAEPPDFPDLTLINPNLKNGRVSSYFAGIQRRFGSSLSVEVNALGTYGRNLLTTDIINRQGTVANGPDGRVTSNLNGVDINYLANQGYSDYNAMTAVVRYRSERGVIQGSYTWSHWIDNQSDPIAGQFFDLNFTSNSNQGGSTSGIATFEHEFDANGDRGNSDYDQRQNLVIFSYWNLPPVLRDTRFAPIFRNWGVAGLAAFRSGFPFTVTGSSGTPSSGGEPYNPRVDIVEPNNIYLSKPIPVAGGFQLLNPAAFQDNPNGGNEGRNALRGPGLYNIDLSLSRSFGIKYLGEAGRLVLRADAFNFLNHANLNQPYPYLNLNIPPFGVAVYGRQGLQSGFPALTPLNETARQIQLLLRLEF